MASSLTPSPTTVAPDAQTWVFPPTGVPAPPMAATGDIGPIHLEDSIELKWTPGNQKPEIWQTCFSDVTFSE
jgi:hypothetical protein